MRIPIQLALQGGGAKITYLVAALEAVQSLEREGLLRVTRIAGTSAGAIAGALYAAGVDMQRARDAFEAERDDLLRAFRRPMRRSAPPGACSRAARSGMPSRCGACWRSSSPRTRGSATSPSPS